MAIISRDGWLNVDFAHHAQIDNNIASDRPSSDCVPSSFDRWREIMFNTEADYSTNVLCVQRRDKNLGKRFDLAVKRQDTFLKPVEQT